MEVLEHPEPAMEAVRRIAAENFLTRIVLDEVGSNFYEGLEYLPRRSYDAVLAEPVLPG